MLNLSDIQYYWCSWVDREDLTSTSHDYGILSGRHCIQAFLHAQENTASGRDCDAITCQGLLHSTSWSLDSQDSITDPCNPSFPTIPRKVVPLNQVPHVPCLPQGAMIITAVDEPFLAKVPLGLESLVTLGERPPGPGKMANGPPVHSCKCYCCKDVSYGQTGTDP